MNAKGAVDLPIKTVVILIIIIVAILILVMLAIEGKDLAITNLGDLFSRVGDLL